MQYKVVTSKLSVNRRTLLAGEINALEGPSANFKFESAVLIVTIPEARGDVTELCSTITDIAKKYDLTMTPLVLIG